MQIFDTWAGVLPPEEFERWCIEPAQRIVAGVRQAVPGAKIIGFPRGAGTKLARYVEQTAVDAVGLDWMVDLQFARDRSRAAGRCRAISIRWRCWPAATALDRGVDAILEALADGPFIFNLGHGILPDTPIAHVEQMSSGCEAG